VTGIVVAAKMDIALLSVDILIERKKMDESVESVVIVGKNRI